MPQEIPNIKSIRPFIGAFDFKVSKDFYKTIGFQEVVVSKDMSLFTTADFGFYLQDYYTKDWIDNTMVFLEVDELDLYYSHLKNLNLPATYKGVKVSNIVNNDWGREFFLHDPSGILWHIGSFN